MAHPRSFVPAANPLHDVIDAYAGAVANRFAATLREALRDLREPHADVAPDRALRLCGYTVETLAGFARGAALAPLHAIAKKAGSPAALSAATEIPAGVPPVLAIVRSIGDAERRPLVDALGSHLHQRLALDVASIRSIARRMLDRCAEPAKLVAMLDVVRDDTASALRFGDQIALGWTTLCTAIEGGAAPAIGHARSRDLWHGWLRTVRGERASAAPVTEWIVQIG